MYTQNSYGFIKYASTPYKYIFHAGIKARRKRKAELLRPSYYEKNCYRVFIKTLSIV